MRKRVCTMNGVRWCMVLVGVALIEKEKPRALTRPQQERPAQMLIGTQGAASTPGWPLTHLQAAAQVLDHGVAVDHHARAHLHGPHQIRSDQITPDQIR